MPVSLASDSFTASVLLMGEVSVTAAKTVAVLGDGSDANRFAEGLRSRGAAAQLYPLVSEGWGGAEVVFVLPGSGRQDTEAYLAPGGVIPSARPDQLIVDIGSLSPDVVAEIAQSAGLAGKRFIDVRWVADGVVCWGGPDDAEPFLEGLFAAESLHVGVTGSAATVGLIVTLVALLTLAGSQEGLVLAAAAGIDPRELSHVISYSSGASPSLAVPLRVATASGARDLMTSERARQELEHLLELGRRLSIPTPLAALAHAWLLSQCRRGRGARPVADLGHFYGSLAGRGDLLAAGDDRPDVDDSPSGERAETCQPRVGFIGLGRMGRPIAARILQAGSDLVVYNRSRAAIDALVAQGATAADSPREIAEQCDVIVTCLPDNLALESVYWGEDGLLGHIRPGQELVDTGTTSLRLTRRIAQAIAARGAVFLDAPVSGTLADAAEGRLTVMVGARESQVGACYVVFRAIGGQIFFMGDTGRGQITKQVNNMLNATNFAATCEAFTLGVAASLDLATLFGVLSRPELASYALTLRGPRVVCGDYTASYTTTLRVKDSLAALELGQEYQVPLPLCALVHQFFEGAIAMGWGSEDWASLAKVYESLAAVNLPRS